MVLLLLDRAACHLKLIIFKVLLKDIYPELRGLVSTEEPSASGDQLISEIDDPFITILRFMCGSVYATIHALNKSHFQVADYRSSNTALWIISPTIINTLFFSGDLYSIKRLNHSILLA